MCWMAENLAISSTSSLICLRQECLGFWCQVKKRAGMFSKTQINCLFPLVVLSKLAKMQFWWKCKGKECQKILIKFYKKNNKFVCYFKFFWYTKCERRQNLTCSQIFARLKALFSAPTRHQLTADGRRKRLLSPKNQKQEEEI